MVGITPIRSSPDSGLPAGARHVGQLLGFAQDAPRLVGDAAPSGVKRTTRRVRSTRVTPISDLQLPQARRQGRLGDEAGLGGAAEMAMVPQRDQILELLEGGQIDGHWLIPINVIDLNQFDRLKPVPICSVAPFAFCTAPTGEYSMLTVGDKLPALTVPVQQGMRALPAGETIDLGRDQRQVEDPVLLAEGLHLRLPDRDRRLWRAEEDFADRDAVLIGASTDTDYVHFAWRKSDERLAAADFPWIADNTRSWPRRSASSTRTRASPFAPPSSSIRTMSSSTSRSTASMSAATRRRRCACSTRCRPTSFARATGSEGEEVLQARRLKRLCVRTRARRAARPPLPRPFSFSRGE